MFNKDRIAALILLSICTFLLIVSLSYPSEASRWPQALLVLLGLCSLNLLITGGLKLKEQGAGVSEVPKLRIVLLAGISVVYIICIAVVGFVVSTFAFLLCMTYLLGIRNKYYILAASVLVSAFTYALFWVILRIGLPRGILF
jgi:hypothetical protein